MSHTCIIHALFFSGCEDRGAAAAAAAAVEKHHHCCSSDLTVTSAQSDGSMLHDSRPSESSRRTGAERGDWFRGRDSSPPHTTTPCPLHTLCHDSAHRPGGTQAAGWLATSCQTQADVSCLHPSWLLSMQNGLRRIQAGTSQRSAAWSHVTAGRPSHTRPPSTNSVF